MVAATSADSAPDRDRSRAPGASPWFVAMCMVAIAASLSAVLYLQVGLSMAEAGWVGLATLMVMVLAEFFSARNRERSAVEAELREMNRVSIGLTRELSGLHGRINGLETSLSDRIDEAIDTRLGTITADLQVLETLVRDLGEALAADRRSAAAPPAAASQPARTEAPAGYFADMPAADAAATVRAAIDAGRLDLLLQPMVTLPQRRVQFYEAFSRLRDEDGIGIPPDDFLPVAEANGLAGTLDNIVLMRCVQVVRRMAQRNRELAIFCNVSGASLADSAFFAQFAEFLSANPELTESLVFEFSQQTFESLGPIEQASLESLAEIGCRFSLDNVRRLDIDGIALAARKVRYVKVDAGMLLDPPEDAGAHIHAADLTRLLARSGIDLVATRIETEAQLVDLLDYDVSLGQGFLFSPPRPVRGEILRGEQPDLANAS